MRWEGFKREVLNLPNMITIGRLFLIPPVLLLIGVDPARRFIAAMLFSLASVLDLIDGWLARRAGLVTVFGKFVDPLADKIMVLAVLIFLVRGGSVPAWVVVVILGREFYISGLRSVASAEGVVIAASAGGKAKTAFQLVGIICVLAYYRYRMPFTDQTLDFHLIGMVFIYVSVVISILSAIEYTMAFRRALEERKTDAAGGGG